MVVGEGFEPSKASPSDLQSDPFDHSGTPPDLYENTERGGFEPPDGVAITRLAIVRLKPLGHLSIKCNTEKKRGIKLPLSGGE